MRKLVVLYDGRCGFCRRCRWWLAAQRAYLELEFLSNRSPDAARRFPGAVRPEHAEELVVVSDEGAVYRGPGAWIMCLYALEAYREWASILSRPRLLPLARQAFERISYDRLRAFCWLDLEDEEALAEAIRKGAVFSETCDVSTPRAGPAGEANGRALRSALDLSVAAFLILFVVLCVFAPGGAVGASLLALAVGWSFRRWRKLAAAAAGRTRRAPRAWA